MERRRSEGFDDGCRRRLSRVAEDRTPLYERGAFRDTIQATALVHEAYLRLVDIRQVRWEERAQFFAIVAKIMRRILIEHARTRISAKRGGGMRPINLNEALLFLSIGPCDRPVG